jgi:signal transduction histidine kinase
MNLPDYKKEIEYLNQIIEKQQAQISGMDRIIRAYSSVEKLTNRELMEAQERAKTEERISHFSAKELRQRDIALSNLLEINKQISSILEEKKLLKRVLSGLVTSLKAERGIIYTFDNDKLYPFVFFNLKKSEIKRSYFEYPKIHIDKTAQTKSTVFKLFHEVADGDGSISFSFVCIPMIYEGRLLGIIYLDIISDEKTFRVQDLDVAEIFASQASISMNNAMLYQKIKNQNLELLKLVNLKDQMYSDFSKNIKEPLNRIYHNLDEVINNNELSKEERVEFLKTMHSQIAGLTGAVEKVLTIQELERQVDDLFVDNVNFRDIFAFLTDYYKESIAEKKVKINIDLSREFENYRANKSVMRTIFDELFSNAIFYNRPGGKVNVKGFRKGDYLVVEISDTGHGIKEKDLPHIFEQFYRTSDSPDLNDKGAGLGLYLVGKFVKHYNGDIKVSSVYGEGSTFSVKFLIN